VSSKARVIQGRSSSKRWLEQSARDGLLNIAGTPVKTRSKGIGGLCVMHVGPHSYLRGPQITSALSLLRLSLHSEQRLQGDIERFLRTAD